MEITTLIEGFRYLDTGSVSPHRGQSLYLRGGELNEQLAYCGRSSPLEGTIAYNPIRAIIESHTILFQVVKGQG